VPFDVFIERPPKATPTEIDQLAESISLRYGVPGDKVLALLRRGRFRVKANVDQPTAAQYVSDLAGLGATCTVVESQGAPPTLPRAPVAIAAIKVAKRAVPLGAPPARAVAPPLLPKDGSASATDIEGLLERIKQETGQFALATLDGASVDIPVFGDLFADEKTAAAAARDPFAPPEADQDAGVFLVTEDVTRRGHKT
jgi:hypothetical protein